MLSRLWTGARSKFFRETIWELVCLDLDIEWDDSRTFHFPKDTLWEVFCKSLSNKSPAPGSQSRAIVEWMENTTSHTIHGLAGRIVTISGASRAVPLGNLPR